MTDQQQQAGQQDTERSERPAEDNVYAFPPPQRQVMSEDTTLLELEKALHNWF